MTLDAARWQTSNGRQGFAGNTGFVAVHSQHTSASLDQPLKVIEIGSIIEAIAKGLHDLAFCDHFTDLQI